MLRPPTYNQFKFVAQNDLRDRSTGMDSRMAIPFQLEVVGGFG
jgi:hypothetical protein